MARYRIEDGRACIDIKVKSYKQLFDIRDPSPFRERDLDEEVVSYISDSANEISTRHPLRLVFLIADEPLAPVEELREAVYSHFLYKQEQCKQQLRDHFRYGQVALVLGLLMLAALTTLSSLASGLTFRGAKIITEGLSITGWVVLWRPLDLLLYDWWPLIEVRRRVRRILLAEVHIRHKPEVHSEASQVT